LVSGVFGLGQGCVTSDRNKILRGTCQYGRKSWALPITLVIFTLLARCGMLTSLGWPRVALQGRLKCRDLCGEPLTGKIINKHLLNFRSADRVSGSGLSFDICKSISSAWLKTVRFAPCSKCQIQVTDPAPLLLETTALIPIFGRNAHKICKIGTFAGKLAPT
jgi:hypothetical protein